MLGHALLFFAASFVQFNFALNKGPVSAILFLVVLASGVYFLGWWALLTFLVGGILGGMMAVSQRVRDAANARREEQDV